MKKLNQKNLDVYLFIKEFINENGYCPTYREIVANTNYSSIATVKEVIEKLAEFKLLKVSRNQNGIIITRSVRVIDNDKTKKIIEDLREEFN